MMGTPRKKSTNTESAPIVEVTPAKTFEGIDSYIDTTPAPQAFISKKSFRVEAICATEQFSGMRPMLEIEYSIPQGAVAPNSETVLAEMYHELALSMIPAIHNQINGVNLKTIIKESDPVSVAAAMYMKISPLFRWLSLMDRQLAREMVMGRVSYTQAVEANKRPPIQHQGNQQPAQPKNPNPRPTGKNAYDKEQPIPPQSRIEDDNLNDEEFDLDELDGQNPLGQ